jgi:hypothetical protein
MSTAYTAAVYKSKIITTIDMTIKNSRHIAALNTASYKHRTAQT